MVALSLAGAAASLAQPLLVSQVIGVVEKGDPLGSLVWVLVGLVVAAGLLSGFQHYLLQRTGTSVVLSARRRLVGRMLRLPISEFDPRRTGDLVSRVGSDTTLLYAVITQGLVDALGGAVVFVGALIAMLIIDPVLLGLTVLVIAVSVVTVVLLSGRIRDGEPRAAGEGGRPGRRGRAGIGAIRTVRAANATDRELAIVEADAEGAWRPASRSRKVSALVVPVAGIALQVSLLVVLGVGGFRVASGAITVANLVAFILFLFMMIMPLGQAFGAITSVNQALGALGRIQEIIACPARPKATPRSSRPRPSTTDAAIAFDDVRFRYPEHRAQDRAREGDRGGRRRGRRRADRPRGAARACSFERPRAARGSRSSARPARARARSSRSSSASTTRPAASCASAASTCARSTARSCARRSATSSRTPRCSPAPCART